MSASIPSPKVDIAVGHPFIDTTAGPGSAHSRGEAGCSSQSLGNLGLRQPSRAMAPLSNSGHAAHSVVSKIAEI